MLKAAWELLRDSGRILLEAAPTDMDLDEVRSHLLDTPHVLEVHDLHVWAMGATEPALTAHLVRPSGSDDAFLCAVSTAIAEKFHITHVTLQIERDHQDCGGRH